MRWGEVTWLFNVTINDISVIYVTAHRCAGGLKLDLRPDSQRNRHLVGFFNVPVQATTRGDPFIRLFRETAPFSRPFYDPPGIRRTHSRLNPRVLTGGYLLTKWKYKNIFTFHSPTPPSPSRRCHGEGVASLRRWREYIAFEHVDRRVCRLVCRSVCR